MLDEQTTPAAEENEPEETVNDDTQEEEETEEEETIGDSIEEKSETDNIPKARLDKEINRRKELEKKVAELETKSEPVDSDLEARLAKIEAVDKAKKLNETLDVNIAKALDEAPEFKDIINIDVIKQMALNPANQSKTYLQLLEDAYGNALGGKRTTETTTPRGGTNDGKVDMAKAKGDKEYFKQVMDSPELKKQYNESLLSESA